MKPLFRLSSLAYLLGGLCCAGPAAAQSNLLILSNTNNTPVPPYTYNYFSYSDLAPELAAPDVTVFNVTIDSLGTIEDSYLPWFYGKFAFDGQSDISIDSGMVLSTGLVAKYNTPAWATAPGYNSGIPWPACYSSGGYNPGGMSILSIGYLSFRLYQHADLVALNGGDSVTDAMILEFDLVPKGSRLRLQYVFASEEYPNMDSSDYPDRVCAMPNDVMAIFLSGPGITGEQNIALVPGTNLPVGVNTITPPGMACNPEEDYSQYYVDNTGGQNVIYNGFTTLLTAYKAVIPCDTYHLRIAVADGALHPDDTLLVLEQGQPPLSLYNSGIFLKFGSLTSIDKFQVVPYGGVAGDTSQVYVVRGCLPGGFRIYRDWAAPYAQALSFSVSGTAISGFDYNPLGNTVTIPAGSDHADIPVQALSAGAGIGSRTLELTLNVPPASSCASLTPSSVSGTLLIVNSLFAEILTPDTAICSGCSAQLRVEADPDLLFSWTPAAGLDSPYIQNPLATPAQTTQYFMTATAPSPVSCPAVSDSVTVATGNAGIGSLAGDWGISVSPNPFRTGFTIRCTNNAHANYQARVTDAGGKVIHSARGSIRQINEALGAYSWRGLASGNYFLTLSRNHIHKTFKLVKRE